MQKSRFLPGIAAGEIHFAIGYLNPTPAPTGDAEDRRAARGATTSSSTATSCGPAGVEAADLPGWPPAPTRSGTPPGHLAADRRRGAGRLAHADPHRGQRTSATYYDNVRVPREMLVGELNGGWKLITAAQPRAPGLGAWADKVFAPFRACCCGPRARRRAGPPRHRPALVRRALADCYARFEAQRTLNFRIAADVESGHMDVRWPPPPRSTARRRVEVLRLLVEIVGASALVRSGSAASALLGEPGIRSARRPSTPSAAAPTSCSAN